MRESIGGAWLFGLVSAFILLFTGFLCVAVNYNKAYKYKNEVIDYIEREEGLTYGTGTSGDIGGSLGLINAFMRQGGYTVKGRCPAGWLGVKDISGEGASNYDYPVNEDIKYYYCVKKNSSFSENNKYTAYYNVRLFFRFELPIFGNFSSFSVEGESTQIIYPGDCYTWGTCKN